MSVIERAPAAGVAIVDPFTLPRAPAPRRPRILSYVGRWGRARRWLPKEALRVLDVGCSLGYGSAAIQAGGPDGRVVVGVERDPEHLRGAGERFAWLTVLEGDATALPVADDSFDAALSVQVLEYVADIPAALAEIRRALRPGGRAVIWDVDWTTISMRTAETERMRRMLDA